MVGNITISDAKQQIGELAKVLRKRHDRTQEQLAEKLGMSRITIQNLDAGRNATLDTVLKVLQHFDMLRELNGLVTQEIDNNNAPSLYLPEKRKRK